MIILDIDDTILDYSSGFLEYIGVELPEKNEKYRNITDYLTSVHSMTHHEVYKSIESFNRAPAFSRLLPFKSSNLFIKKLREQSIQVHLITSCGDNAQTRKLRERNLYEVFEDSFEEVHVLPLMASKRPVLKKYTTAGPLFVDDTIEHYITAKEIGISAMIMDTQFNTYDTGDTSFILDWNSARGLYNDIL